MHSMITCMPIKCNWVNAYIMNVSIAIKLTYCWQFTPSSS